MAIENVSQSTTGDDDVDLDQLYEKVMTCEPLIAPAAMDQLADLVFSKERVIHNWRMAALIASKDGAFFKEMASDPDKAKALAPIVGALDDAAELLRSMAEIMTSVSIRIGVAGCAHEDFNKWTEEAAA